MRKFLLITVMLMFASACGSGSSPKRISIEAINFIPSPTTTSTSTTSTTTSTIQPKPPSTTKTTSHIVVNDSGLWARIRACENGGSYDKGTSPGYFGAYQFSQDTWSTASSHAKGGTWGSATPEQQEAAKDWLFTHSDPYHQWPVCYPRAIRSG